MAGGASRDAVSGKSDQAARRKAEGGEAVHDGRGGQASRSIAANAADVDGSGEKQRAGPEPAGAHTAGGGRRYRPAEEGGETAGKAQARRRRQKDGALPRSQLLAALR